jgi:hypothetical protein
VKWVEQSSKSSYKPIVEFATLNWLLSMVSFGPT